MVLEMEVGFHSRTCFDLWEYRATNRFALTFTGLVASVMEVRISIRERAEEGALQSLP